VRLLHPRGDTPVPEGSHERRVADKRVDQLVFLAALAMRWWEANRLAFKILRIITLLMIPFCWIVFYDGRFFPREGHSLWVASMVLALFSEGSSSSPVITADSQP
jgi:hypothetical protein